MKIVLQRVSRAHVAVDGVEVGRVGRGLCLLVGIEKGDSDADVERLAAKSAELRVFPDAAGKMNLSVAEVGGGVLAVSQFTLAGSTEKGRRPGFDNAEEPSRAAELFRAFVEALRGRGLAVATGVFQAVMEVHIVNDGPVTFVLASR
ncbi:MAG: D-aminoacyl-tRNA deacylase [Candidatus Aminicenantes bacterium]|nr:D-aminoacyl-tRNA deacylase [Candidatus Aminicenantes bacterium]